MKRKHGPIQISEELRKLLYELRIRTRVKREPHLDLSQLAHVEQLLSISFPNDVLALLASHIEAVEAEYNMRLMHIPRLSHKAWEFGIPKQWVAMGHIDFEVFLCLNRVAANSKHTMFYDYCKQDQTIRKYSLLSWLRETKDAFRELTTQTRGISLASHPYLFPKTSEGGWTHFQPLLIEPTSDIKPLVVHPKFGEGRVTRILEDVSKGKLRLEVDFDLVGTKITSSKYLKFYEEFAC